MESALTKGEQTRLAALEKVVDDGEHATINTANALWTIRDEDLFRATHSTFEAYVAERFSFTRQRAYQLLVHHEVVNEMSTHVDIPPPTESQTRILGELDSPQDRATAMVRHIENAPKRADGTPKPSNKGLRKEVDAIKPPAAKPEPTNAELRKKGLNLKGQLVRLCEDLGLLESLRSHLEAIGKGLGQ